MERTGGEERNARGRNITINLMARFYTELVPDFKPSYPPTYFVILSRLKVSVDLVSEVIGILLVTSVGSRTNTFHL